MKERQKEKIKSIQIDVKTHERFREFCRVRGYVISKTADRILNEWMDRGEK